MQTHHASRDSITDTLAFDYDELTRRFFEQFGSRREPRIFQAPGRVNLIGEHTDYNDGFVMPSAINFHTWVAVTARDDNQFTIHSSNFNETKTFDLGANLVSTHHWSDYVLGVVLQLRQAGVGVRGANLLINGNVPLGSGLSSSASVEIATAFALNALFDGHLERRQLATLCQRAENEFVGARCGIMDQFIAAHGKSGHALILDCRSLDYELLPLPANVSLVICNTMVKHQLASGEYNVRRQECEEGVALLRKKYPKITALRDVSADMLDASADVLPKLIYRRCRQVVHENHRVTAAAKALKASDLNTFGKLMYESHASLRDDYQVSCPELDAMVEIATNQSGVIGARMTGGGFGGCTINLVRNEAVTSFCSAVDKEYREQTGIAPAIYVTMASDGASELTDK